MYPGTGGLSGSAFRNLSRCVLKLLTGQLLISLICFGSELKILGPLYVKLEAKRVLILSGADVGSDFLTLATIGRFVSLVVTMWLDLVLVVPVSSILI